MVKLYEKDIKTKEVKGWKGAHLLHFASSSCSQKVRIVLNLKGIDYVSHPINLLKAENYSQWFLGINPRGLLPRNSAAASSQPGTPGASGGSETHE